MALALDRNRSSVCARSCVVILSILAVSTRCESQRTRAIVSSFELSPLVTCLTAARACWRGWQRMGLSAILTGTRDRRGRCHRKSSCGFNILRVGSLTCFGIECPKCTAFNTGTSEYECQLLCRNISVNVQIVQHREFVGDQMGRMERETKGLDR